VLLPAQQQLSLAPTSLALKQQQVTPAAAGSSGSSKGRSSGSNNLFLNPAPLTELGLRAGDENVTVLLPNGPEAAAADSSSNSSITAAAAAVNGLSKVWPPPGGQPIDCPAEIRGMVDGTAPRTVVDVAFVRGLFAVSGLTETSTDAATVGAAATTAVQRLAPSGGVLRFVEVQLRNLPQGAGAYADVSNGTASSSIQNEPGTAVGDAAWMSLLPAEAYTHLLWFASR
jgi:hypothetical protein